MGGAMFQKSHFHTTEIDLHLKYVKYIFFKNIVFLNEKIKWNNPRINKQRTVS